MQSLPLGTRIRLAREAKQIRQEDVAAEGEVTQQAVQKWEAGETVPRGLTRIAKLAKLLGLNAADIRADDPPSATESLFTAYDLAAKQNSRRGIGPSAPPLDKPARGEYFRSILSSPAETSQHEPSIREQVTEKLLHALPPNLRPHALGSFYHKGIPYEFSYLSRKVVATVLPTSTLRDMFSIAHIRQALYRMAFAIRFHNDPHVPSHHYFVGVLPPTVGSKAKIPRALLNEAALFGILLEVTPTVLDFADRVAELEDLPTELDELYEDEKARRNEQYNMFDPNNLNEPDL